MVNTKAFTLLEVIVTMVLLAVIGGAAVAGTTAFLNRTKDTGAISALDNTTLLQQSFANGFGTYASAPEDITGVDRDLTLVAGTSASTSGSTVSMSVGDQGTLGLAVQSDSGTCFLRSVGALDVGAVVIEQSTEGEPCNGMSALPETEAALPVASLR